MRRRLNAWLACSPPERRLLAGAWLLLPGIAAALRVLPLPRAQALLGRVARPRPPRPAGVPIAADRLAWLVGAAARHHLWSVTCLEKSLVLEALLRRCDFHPELRIGVRREGGDLVKAHAWVEVDGRPVGEAPDVEDHFPPFREVPPQ